MIWHEGITDFASTQVLNCITFKSRGISANGDPLFVGKIAKHFFDEIRLR